MVTWCGGRLVYESDAQITASYTYVPGMIRNAYYTYVRSSIDGGTASLQVLKYLLRALLYIYVLPCVQVVTGG